LSSKTFISYQQLSFKFILWHQQVQVLNPIFQLKNK